MTVGDLIAILESYDDPDAEVRLLTQPSWPFESQLRGVIGNHELAAERDLGDAGGSPYGGDEIAEGDFNGDVAPFERVFLVEGLQLRYGPRDAWAAI